MMTFRLMSYHINGANDAQGQPAPEKSAEIIRAQQPDLVFLQQIGGAIGTASICNLARQVGLDAYGPDAEGGCAFLSREPLTAIQSVPLGYGCRCVKADLVKNDERVHLFNLTLSMDPWQRNQQLHLLFSEQLVNNPALPCPAIIAGDFGLPLLGESLTQMNGQLRRARYPLWRSTFPARVPLWGRDRIYFRGAIRAMAGHIVLTSEARKASTHLPMVLTVETSDTRQILKIKKLTSLSAKHPNPICG